VVEALIADGTRTERIEKQKKATRSNDPVATLPRGFGLMLLAYLNNIFSQLAHLTQVILLQSRIILLRSLLKHTSIIFRFLYFSRFKYNFVVYLAILTFGETKLEYLGFLV
jgi:hypothetical protein